MTGVDLKPYLQDPAAEKLRALETTLKTDDTEEWEGAMIDLAEAMAAALPQIVALVEAAEAYVRADKEYQRRIDVVDIRAALAALDEQLGDLSSP